MSLIEKAAKRLEELKRTGVAVPDDLSTEGVEHNAITHYDSSEPEYTPLSTASAEETNGPVQYSRQVDFDLSRLASMGMVTPEAPHSPIANEFRVVKRPLLANAQGKSAVPVKNGNLMMVTSALPGEGKSFSALNLAMSIAMELDSTVLLVDADVANPNLLKVLGLPPTRGLMDVLTSDEVSLSDVILRTSVEKLSILPSGTHHQRATEVLASDVMAQLVAEMAARYPDRVIIFDSPPLLPTTESRVLATHMGQIVVVVEADTTTHSNLKQALGHLEDCPVVMTMLNKAVRSEVAQYYGYYGYSRATQA